VFTTRPPPAACPPGSLLSNVASGTGKVLATHTYCERFGRCKLTGCSPALSSTNIARPASSPPGVTSRRSARTIFRSYGDSGTRRLRPTPAEASSLSPNWRTPFGPAGGASGTSGQNPKRYHALQALAIRDRRVYVLGAPTVPSGEVIISLDLAETNIAVVRSCRIITNREGVKHVYRDGDSIS
jgi:hypothetical protein